MARLSADTIAEIRARRGYGDEVPDDVIAETFEAQLLELRARLRDLFDAAIVALPRRLRRHIRP